MEWKTGDRVEFIGWSGEFDIVGSIEKIESRVGWPTLYSVRDDAGEVWGRTRVRPVQRAFVEKQPSGFLAGARFDRSTLTNYRSS